ncbi:MAG: NAD(P)-dependent oxidoreductase [Kiloniellales bacterium]
MARPRVVVTSRWPAAVEAALSARFDTTFTSGERVLSGGELSDVLASADAVLPGINERMDSSILASDQVRTKLVANSGFGEDFIDLDAARARGITVTNTPDELSGCTADLTLMLMISLARQVTSLTNPTYGMTPGNDWSPSGLTGAALAGKTLGIVGFGRVGHQVARRAHWGFGMKVAVYDPQPIDPACLARKGAEQRASIDEVVAEADFLTLHCSDARANRHLIDARRLDLMKPTAYLVNTARGEVVEGQALLHALWFDTIAGAALDAYGGEAEVLDHLQACPNAVLSPHLSRSVVESREALGLRVVQNIEDFFAGRRPRDCVTV